MRLPIKSYYVLSKRPKSCPNMLSYLLLLFFIFKRKTIICFHKNYKIKYMKSNESFYFCVGGSID